MAIDLAYKVPQSELAKIFADLNQKYELQMRVRKSDLEALNMAIYFAVGRYFQVQNAITVEALVANLAAIETSIATLNEFLGQLNGGMCNTLKLHAVLSVVDELVLAGFDPTRGQAEARLRFAEMAFTPITIAARGAIERAKRTKGRTGRPRNDWYDYLAVAFVDLAERNGLRPSVTTDRDDGRKFGPFLELVRRLETFLPDVMRSKTEAACAQRLERAKRLSDLRRREIQASLRPQRYFGRRGTASRTRRNDKTPSEPE